MNVVMLPSSGRLLALDWGERRIGVALSDENQLLASPLTTLTRRPGKRFPMPAFLQLVADYQPLGILVGLPLGLDGAENEHTALAREMAEQVGERARLPVALWDERLTTAAALRSIRDQEGSTRGRKEDVDAMAASVLLQHYLDARRLQA